MTWTGLNPLEEITLRARKAREDIAEGRASKGSSALRKIEELAQDALRLGTWTPNTSRGTNDHVASPRVGATTVASEDPAVDGRRTHEPTVGTTSRERS